MTPDLDRAPEIGFVHRHLPYAEIYFVANTSNHPVNSPAKFRTGDLKAAWWNPMDGHISAAPAGGAALDLAPYESRVIVFSKIAEGGLILWGHQAASNVTIDPNWTVTFGSGPAETMNPLRSWTEDPARRFYSGTASYETAAEVSSSPGLIYLSFGEGTPVTTVERRAGSGMRAMLESPVREAAKVYVNGQLAGSVWSPPYEIYVGNLLHQGRNTIRVVVANLALNEMAKGPLPDYKALNAKYGERFQPQDMQDVQPVPAGMLQPVRAFARYEIMR